ncbi:MAG: (d)CMP kinase [Woeseiaceae bacterium]|nr:(d)CMP kinase [Woeseiaceae bacterium]
MIVPVLTIDGPSGSGKGTIARKVAIALDWHLLDSGALYRLVGFASAKKGVSTEIPGELAELARHMTVRFGSDDSGNEQIWLDGEEVSAHIRTEKAGERASVVASIPAVREALLEFQRGFRKAPGLVADGRDMGTQVFADAELKVFLTASAEERAKRRHKQLKDKGIDVSLAALSRDIEDRDRRDSQRTVAPLKPAEDAHLIDSSDMSIDDVTELVMSWARKTWEM